MRPLIFCVKNKMIKIITTAMLVITFTCSGSAFSELHSLDVNKDNSLEPSLPLPEAISLAQDYIERNKIDISQHYLDNIRLLQSSTLTEGKHWILTWARKVPSDGGQIFIIIGMNKKIERILGR